MATTFNRKKIRQEVYDYLGTHVNEYDIDGIVGELRDYNFGYGEYINFIDDVEPNKFYEMLDRCILWYC